MVCEVKMGEGQQWEAFLAYLTPQALDDQLKNISYTALSRAFAQLNPHDMLRAIPMTMPMTHLATRDGKLMEGIAKYPLDAWEKAGNPCFTSEKWAMLCMRLADVGKNDGDMTEEDEAVFKNLFTVSSTMIGAK